MALFYLSLGGSNPALNEAATVSVLNLTKPVRYRLIGLRSTTMRNYNMALDYFSKELSLGPRSLCKNRLRGA